MNNALLEDSINDNGLTDDTNLFPNDKQVKAPFKAKYAIVKQEEDDNKDNEYNFSYNCEDTYSVSFEVKLNPSFGGKDQESSDNSIQVLNINHEKFKVNAIIQNLNQLNETIRLELNHDKTHIAQATEISFKDTQKNFLSKRKKRNKEVQRQDSETESLHLNSQDNHILNDNEIQFDLFTYEIHAYNIIQIKTGLLNHEKNDKEKVNCIIYLLLEKEEEFIDLLTKLLYAMLFSKQSLENYINKYIYNTIINFVSFPNTALVKFIASFKKKETKEEKTALQNISYEIKKDYFSKIKIKKYYLFTNKNAYFDNVESTKKSTFENSKKGKTVDPLQIVTSEFAKINQAIHQNNEGREMESMKKNVLSFITKLLVGFTTYKGFFSIEAIINDEEKANCACCKNKKTKEKCNNFLNSIILGGISCINSILKMNEGYSHKHITVLDLAYNFNDKNIIHIFPKNVDSSPKNRMRFFDIPFHELWLMQIASIILSIYTQVYGLLSVQEISANETAQRLTDNTPFIRDLFKSCVMTIKEEFFACYFNVLPNFYGFSENMVLIPLKGYRCVDNVCQHFANTSSNILIQKSCMYFVPYDENDEEVYQKYQKPIPTFKAILEPYLIMSDEKSCQYAQSGEKDKYLQSINFNEEKFFEEMNRINVKKDTSKEMPISFSSDDSPLIVSNEPKSVICYDYMFLMNYSFLLDFKLSNEIFELLSGKKKSAKTSVIDLLAKKTKIRNKGEKLAYLYYDYMKFTLKDFKQDENPKQFIKSGYFLVNLSSFTSEDSFFKSKWYCDIFESGKIEISNV